MCIRVQMGDSVGFVSVGGPERTILVGGQTWHFEMHHYFGPMPIKKRTGAGRDGTKAFWEAVTYWAQQGERLDEAGVCVYDTPQPKPLYHLGGRNYTEDPAMAARFGVTEPMHVEQWRRKKRSAQPPTVDAVDPHVESEGKLTTRV